MALSGVGNKFPQGSGPAITLQSGGGNQEAKVLREENIALKSQVDELQNSLNDMKSGLENFKEYFEMDKPALLKAVENAGHVVKRNVAQAKLLQIMFADFFETE